MLNSVLRVMKYTLIVDTYTRKEGIVPALTRVRGALETAIEDAQAEQREILAKLQSYDAVGMGFEVCVCAYIYSMCVVGINCPRDRILSYCMQNWLRKWR